MSKFLRLEQEHLLFAVFAAFIFLFHNSMGADYYWHLEAGKYIKESGAIPTGDPFSFTFFGEPWVLHEWLFELCLYQIYLIAGHYGIQLFVALGITAALYTAYRASVIISGSKLHSIVITAVTFIIFHKFALPRPQLVTYLFFAIYLYTLLGYKHRSYHVNLYWLPIIMAFWVNMHGGYIIGIVLLALFIAAEASERLLTDKDSNDLAMRLRPLLLTLAFCLGASLLNPYSYHQWVYPFQVTSMTTTKHIAEWLSPNFHLINYKIYLFYFIGYLFLSNFTVRRAGLSETLLPLAFIAMSLISKRHTPLALLTILPQYARVTSDLGFSRPKFEAFTRGIFSPFTTGKNRPRTARQPEIKAYIFNWSLMAVLILSATSIHNAIPNRLDTYTSRVVEFVRNNGITGNVLNSYSYGGYLLFKLYPDSRVFIDGRADLYGDAFYNTYQTIYNATDGWEERLANYNIDYILLPDDAPVVRKLCAGKTFRLVYRDEVFSVLVRNAKRFKELIDKYGTRYASDKQHPCGD